MRVNNLRSSRIIVAVLAFAALHAPAAQSRPGQLESASAQMDDFATIVRDICTVSLKLAVADLQPFLDREPRLRGVNTKVVVEADHEYKAGTSFADRRVSISQGFCYVNWLYNWASSLAAVAGSQGQLIPYSRYLTNLSMQPEQSSTQSRAIAFETFAKIDLKTLPADRLSIAQRSAISSMKGILAFAVAHEFGHLALNHQPAAAILPMEARKQEYAADLFALKMLSSPTLPDYATLQTLLLLSMNTLAEREIGRAFAQSSSHPPTHCRQALIDREGRWLEATAADPTARSALEKSLGRSMTEMLNLRNTVLKSCPTP